MSSPLARVDRRAAAVLVVLVAIAPACATSAGMHRGREAELPQDFDRAVLEHTKLARANPANTDARVALERATLRAPHEHAVRGRPLSALTASTHTFYRVTAPRTITIVPDTPAKRREYEESIIRTFYLSNADVKETIDLLRVVVDIRQISPVTATNSISIKDTPERVAAAA